MKLRIFAPESVVVEAAGVTRIVADGAEGSFGILEHHLDLVAILVPGILSYIADGTERFAAHDDGVLVKAGDEVTVSALRAVRGDRLGELRATVEREYARRGEDERLAREALARLESGMTRGLLKLRRE